MTYTISCSEFTATITFDTKQRVIEVSPKLAWMKGLDKRSVESVCIKRGYLMKQHD